MATRSKHVLLFLSAAVVLVAIVAPTRAQRLFPGEIEIRQALERLNTLGSVMMVGAHPDDDREVVLAYLSRGRHVRTAYLSLTRGEGGQNLIGPEQGDELGIIRTQELLASRRIEGSEQYFTRAIDFGFSKTADESLQKWQRDKVLGDVVWNIRRFRPDVVIDVFTGTPRDGHGHHQVSAILGQEAFSAAADPTKFPEQLAYVQTWQAKRLMQNPIAIQQNDQKGKEEARLEIDVGEYSPELGYSYGEIGAISRSTNRSQGQGTAERKGSQKQAFITVAGDKATKDIFDGIDVTWNRIPGGGPVGALLKQTLDSFVPAHPEALLPALAQARGMIAALLDATRADSTKDSLAARKLQELDEAMALASGLSLEAQAASAEVTPGSTLRVNITAIRRSTAPVTLTGVSLSGMEGAPALNLEPVVLADNQPGNYTLNVHVPDNQPYSQPYWLEQPKDGNLYSVRDPRNIGLAENAPVLEAHFTVKVAGADIILTRPVQNRYTDQVYGELVRPLAVVPPVSIDLTEHSLVFADTQPRKIEVPIRSNAGKPSGEAHLEVPAGWKVEPATQPLRAGRHGRADHSGVRPDSSGRAGARNGSRRRDGGRPERIEQHRGDSVSALPGPDPVSAGGSVAGSRRHQEPVEEYRVRDGRGRRSARLPAADRLRGDDVERRRLDSRRSVALRRCRHRRSRVEYARGFARELPALIRLRIRTAARWWWNIAVRKVAEAGGEALPRLQMVRPRLPRRVLVKRRLPLLRLAMGEAVAVAVVERDAARDRPR